MQQRARRAKDPKELAQIIDEMNKLLANYEDALDNSGTRQSGKTGKARQRKKH